MKKHIIKRAASLLLVCTVAFGLLPLPSAQAGKITPPPDFLGEGTQSYYEWRQVKDEYDMIKSAEWTPILLYFSWDANGENGYYLSSDATVYEDTTKGRTLWSYFECKNVANASYLPLQEPIFFTASKYQPFFVKFDGYDKNDHPRFKFRACDAAGNPTNRYIANRPWDERGGLSSDSLRYQNAMKFVSTEAEASSYSFVDKKSAETKYKYKDLEQNEFIIVTDGSAPEDDGVPTAFNQTNLPARRLGIGDPTIRSAGDYGTYPNAAPLRLFIERTYSANFITKDITVQAGKTMTLSGANYIEDGVTIHVPRNATLVIDGTVYSRGKISTADGTIIVRPGATLSYYNDSLGTDLRDWKGSELEISGSDPSARGTLIVCEGAKVITHGTLKMSGHTVCENYGVVIVTRGLNMYGNSVFNNRETGRLIPGGVMAGAFVDFSKMSVTSTGKNRVVGGVTLPVAGTNVKDYQYLTSALGQFGNYSEWAGYVSKNSLVNNYGDVAQATFFACEGRDNWCTNMPGGTQEYGSFSGYGLHSVATFYAGGKWKVSLNNQTGTVNLT